MSTYAIQQRRTLEDFLTLFLDLFAPFLAVVFDLRPVSAPATGRVAPEGEPAERERPQAEPAVPEASTAEPQAVAEPEPEADTPFVVTASASVVLVAVDAFARKPHGRAGGWRYFPAGDDAAEVFVREVTAGGRNRYTPAPDAVRCPAGGWARPVPAG